MTVALGQAINARGKKITEADRSERFRKKSWKGWQGYLTDITLVSPDPDHRLAAMEIELESNRYNDTNIAHYLRRVENCAWQPSIEGSLRNGGFEVVFKKPLPLPTALGVLSQVTELFEGAIPTFRAAVHCHLNVQDFTREDYLRSVLAYSMLEPLLFKSVGEGRDESIFCVPWTKSNGHVVALVEAYVRQDAHAWWHAIHSAPKYAGLNLSATSTFGSLEFRHMQTPVLDTPEESINSIGKFVLSCNNVLDLACGGGGRESLVQFLDYVLNMTPESIPTPHLAEVYSLVAKTIAIDKLTQGVSTKAAKTILKDNQTNTLVPGSIARRYVGRNRVRPTWSRSTPYGTTGGRVMPDTPDLPEEVVVAANDRGGL